VIELSGQFLNVMVIIMLAVVGGLVLMLHYRLYALKNNERDVPVLVSSLADSLQKAHRGVFELSRLVRENGPNLEKEVFKAQQTLQDLDFMLDKAERLLKRMDTAFEKADSISSPVLNAVKTDEKNTLLGKQQESAQVKTGLTVKPEMKPKKNVENTASNVTEAAKKLEAEMQKTLERELLMGLQEENPEPVRFTPKNEEQSKRMASPQRGAMAYGQQFNTALSDTERDLRQALEGRL
tara:strand:- start:80453 stop:81166 length:714 start_codon:yes stop_codon:yes gene_type:complete